MGVRRLLRWLGTLLAVAGVLVLTWSVLVWRWEDPFTAAYTYWEQRQLEDAYEQQIATYTQLPTRRSPTPQEVGLAIAEAARRYRAGLEEGDPIGRLRIPRLGLSMIVVNGTDEDTLKKGPARHRGTYLPGEGQLIYVAGHRTTYSAPFADIDELRRGDTVSLELPYGTFRYRITRHRVVGASDVEVLRTRGREELALQACHPRFFASQRYIAYARPVRVEPRSGPAYAYEGIELSAVGAGRLPD
jgi:sortase A